MKRVKIKIMFLVGGTVMVTLFILLLVFNVGIYWQIEKESITAIEQNLMYYEDYFDEELYSEDEEAGLYAVDEIYIDESESKKSGKNYEKLYSRKQQQIIQWCEVHDVRRVQKAKIGSGVYYLQETEYKESGKDIERYIIYVDVTGEYEAIYRINIVFFFAAIFIGIVGSIIGYTLGKRLEENELAQKKFFENTSHELKTPLTVIKGYAEGIEQGVITDCKKTGYIIADQTDRMSKLVEEIMCIAKVESGALPIHKEAVSVSEFIQDCLMPFERIVINRGLDVRLSVEDKEIQMDQEQFEHAISNIISNAIKYAKSTIEISFNGSELSIWNDTGEISDDELKHIFDRFYSGKNGNTGIGLALAKDIIELHGFFVTAQKDNGGICFIVRCK